MVQLTQIWIKVGIIVLLFTTYNAKFPRMTLSIPSAYVDVKTLGSLLSMKRHIFW